MLKRRALLVSFFCLVVVGCMGQNKTTKQLRVTEIIAEKNTTLSAVSELLEKHTGLHDIKTLNWDAFTYQPEVRFRIAHANNQIWLTFYVREKNILAEVGEVNGGVSGDSCVEFFFDPRADGAYYNFEFSCIGMPHLAYGPGRGKREFIDAETIKREISIRSSLGDTTFSEKTGDYSWQMTMIIPASVLKYDADIQLKGLKTRANFYKCGDKTSERHYLSWNPVETERPDFHRPEFFGTLFFE